MKSEGKDFHLNVADAVYAIPRSKAILDQIFKLKTKCTISYRFSMEINPLKPSGQYMYQ